MLITFCKTEKESSATLPKPEQKKSDRGLKISSHSSFSKFEEKRLRQSETLKKANLLKFSVFKKSSTGKHTNVGIFFLILTAILAMMTLRLV